MLPRQTISHLGLFALCLSALPCDAQDIEPRRWSHLPLGANFAGADYAYTEGDIFVNNSEHHEDPYLIGQGHLIYTFMPGLWLGLSGGYGYGGESTINQVSADDRKGNLGFGVSAGIPVSRNFGFKLAYVGIRTREDTGSDNDTFTIACSLQW